MAKKRPSAQGQGFVDDICAHPGDDTPRLIYADWLEENGDPARAELIRVQCRLATMAEDAPEYLDLEERAWELLLRHQKTWLQDVPGWARKEPCEFRRGFVGRISITATQLLRQGQTLFRMLPIQDLHVRAVGHRLAEVVTLPWLSGLTALDLSGNDLVADDLRALTTSRHLAGLTSLGLRRTALNTERIKVLADWRGLARIRRLDAAQNDLDEPALRVLLGSRNLSGLTHLDLGGTNLGIRGANILAESQRLGNLTHLGLARCEIGPAVLRILTESPVLANLTSLDLRDNMVGGRGWPGWSVSLGAEGAAALASLANLRRLRRLELRNNQLSAEGCKVLASACFPSLTALGLGRNPIEASGMLALAESSILTRLTSLDVSGCWLDDKGTAALANAKYKELRSLDLTFNRIRPDGIRALATSPHLSNLRRLNLGHSAADEESALVLAVSPHLGELRELTVFASPPLSADVVRTVATSPRLPHLARLSIRGHYPPEALAGLDNVET